MKIALGFTVAKLLALLALVLSLGNCATLRSAWEEEEADWRKFCGPQVPADLQPCSCMNSATPSCPPIPNDDGDNPSLMAKKLRAHARWHKQQQTKGAQ